MSDPKEDLLISWISKANEVIPFHRIICVKKAGVSNCLCVRLEEDNSITIGASEVDDFMEKYTLFLHLSQLVQIPIGDDDIPGPGPIVKRKPGS